MATQKLFSVTVMFKEEDFPFENKKKEMFSVETEFAGFNLQCGMSRRRNPSMSQINEQRTFAKCLSLQKIFLAKRLLLQNKLFLKSYISSRNRKFLDIPWLWELFTGENLTTAEAKSPFTSAISTKTTPADTNKRTERHKKRRIKRQ